MIVKDNKTKSKREQLFEEIGLNSPYRQYLKRMDIGDNSLLNGILTREGMTEAEKCYLDPQVSTCFLLLAFSLMKKEIKFEAINEGLKKDINKSKKMADFMNFSLKKLGEGGAKQLIFDLFTAKFFGWSLVEKVYDLLDNSQSRKWNGYFYYKYCQSKRIGLWDFTYNQAGRVIGYQSLIDRSKTFDKNKFMSISYLPLFGNKNGSPDFARVWKFWDAKCEFIIFLLDLGARLSKGRQAALKNMGTASNFSDDDKEEALKNLSENLNVYVPTGFEVEFHNFDTGALQYFLAVLRWIDSQIAIAMLGSSLSVNESQGAGTNAQSTVHNENKYTFESYAEALITDEFEESFMKDLLKLNFNNEEYPEELYPCCELKFDKEETENEKADLCKKLKDIGILDTDTETDLNFLREKFNLPENKELFDSIDTILNKVKEPNNNDNLDGNDDNLDNTNTSKMYS